jgi:NAD(P)-dependent dehydrogenase (short-subunit alcohol dehydrogenase family)
MSTVLITGCSTGFGELAALTFADLGHRVFATMRTPGKSAAIAARTDIEQLALDVCDSASVDAAVAEVVARAGGIDVLVNNAGIEMFGAVHLLSDAEVLRQLDTNVVGVVRMARAVVPVMLAGGGGAIVNVGSLAGLVGVPYSGMYAASKHAVEALTEAMHFELSQQGIRVSVIEPGQFATALGANSSVAAAMTADTPEFARWQSYRTAQRRLVNGEPAAPQLVVDAIVRAALERPGQLRHPVGADADLVGGAKRSMSFEEFDGAMRAVLDWQG